MGARLVAVVDEVRRALLDAPPGPFRLASLCAGEGRDLAGALTGHPRSPDVDALLIPSIRQWFDAAGCAASGFQSAGPGGWAVGAERFEGPAQAVTSGLRLFRFGDDLW